LNCCCAVCQCNGHSRCITNTSQCARCQHMTTGNNWLIDCYPHMPIGKVWIYFILSEFLLCFIWIFVFCILCLFMCVCVCLYGYGLRITLPRIKLLASNFARWFIGVQGRESPILWNFGPPEAPEAQNLTYWPIVCSLARTWVSHSKEVGAQNLLCAGRFVQLAGRV